MSTVAQKFLVALTGLFMLIFLLAHLAGNLEIFKGPDAINHYGVFLRTFPVILWLLRIGLIISVIIHVYVTVKLTKHNQLARPENYHVKKSRKASLESRTMMLSGLTILCFVLYHLAHYTWGITNPEFINLHDNLGRHHVYNMMIMGFSNPVISGFYILAQILLAFHLSHGISSAARTLGVSNTNIFTKIKLSGQVFAVLICTAYTSIPLAVMFGYLTLDL